MTHFLRAIEDNGSCKRTRRVADEGHDEAAAMEVWSRTATLKQVEMNGLYIEDTTTFSCAIIPPTPNLCNYSATQLSRSL